MYHIYSMKRLLLIFFILLGSIGYSQVIHTDFPKKSSVEFTDTKIIVKTDGFNDMNFNILSKDVQNNFDVYSVSGNIKITHAKNFPTPGFGIIEFGFINTKTKEIDYLTYSYKIE